MDDSCNKIMVLNDEMARAPENNNKLKDTIITLNYDLVMDYILYHFADNQYKDEMAPLTLLNIMYNLCGKTTLIFRGDRPSLYWQVKG